MTEHRRRVRRAAALLATAAAVAVTAVGTACFELSGPGDGVFSVDRIIMPSFAVADSDTLRDSTAKATPLRVVARDGAGNVIPDVDVQFVALDSGIIILPGNFLRGTVVRTGARVVALVGPDKLQTQPETVAVTLPPVSAQADPTATEIPFPYPARGVDTLSVPFGLKVFTTGETPLQNWEVRFTIVESTVTPAAATVVPIQLIEPTSGRATRAVATKADGLGQVRLRITPIAIQQKADSADVVKVRAFTTVGTGRAAHVDSVIYTFRLKATAQ